MPVQCSCDQEPGINYLPTLHFHHYSYICANPKQLWVQRQIQINIKTESLALSRSNKLINKVGSTKENKV